MKGWLDQYQKGGIVDKYLPTDRFLQPNSEKLPIGYRIPTNIPSSELASSIGGEGGEPAYLIPTFKYGQSLSNPLQEYKNTGEHLGGPFKTWQEAEEFEKIRHSYVEKNQPIPFPLKTRSYQNGGELKYYQNGTDFKPKSIGQFGKTVSHEYIDKLKEFENTTKNFGYHVDSRKIPTIGYGHRLTDKEKKEKIIYIGEEKVPFDKFKGAEGQMYADRLLQEQDIPSHYDKMIKLYGDKYSQPVKDVLFDIVYQQGNAKNSAKFLKGSYPNIKEWQDYLTSAANESSGGDKTRMQWRANALSKDPSNWFLGNMLPYAQPAVRDMTNLPTYKYGGEISSAQSGKLIPTDTKKNIHTGKPVISSREEWEKQQQKSELAEWIKKQNQYQREHSDIYTDPQTGKQVVQNIGIEPTVSPIDAAVLGVAALYSGGAGLLGNMINLLNPIPTNSSKLFSKYLTQEEAVLARAERMLKQKDKWVDQPSYVEELFKTASERHYPESMSINPRHLGINNGQFTEVAKLAPLSKANKARIASHEVGHYYRNSPFEANKWNSFFDFSGLSRSTRNYLQGKPIVEHDINLIKGDIGDINNIVLRKNILAKGNADEIRERAAQLKDYIAQKNKIPLNEDFIVTETQLNGALKNYIRDTRLDNQMSQYISALRDKKGFLNAMNEYPLSIIPTTILGTQFIDSKKENGGIIEDDNGYWNPDNWGKPVQINSNRITMKGVDVPLLGISDAQDVQLMQPNGEYLFKGTSVVELPIASKGKTINGWMDKYNK